MSRPERQQNVLELLKGLRGIEPLKQLFWSELNYQRVNQPLSRRGWTESASKALADDPVLFAGGGEDNAFHVIYARLASDKLLHGGERPVVSRLLNEHPYTLFVFSNAAQDHWHFLNVKYDEASDKRRLFRRITVGPEEKLRTASERMSLLSLDTISPALFGLAPLTIQQHHDEAFDVEAVTKQFFEEYKALFGILQDEFRRQTKDNEWAHDYALQLLNRCMFLYFVQRKRWLGDDTEFLRSFWEAYQRTGQPKDSFFEKWLRVLFFEAFNNKFHGGHRHFPDNIKSSLAIAPYLNGGLFADNALDNKHEFAITDARFKQVFTFLERYNFTIAEDSPLDQEVAVDPEMIGKVYESLVNVSTEADERGDAGIFYTPRTEIDLMCRLAVVNYLANHLGNERKKLLYEMVFAFEADEKLAADRAVALAKLWPQLDALFRAITAVDLACGSGSFVVGMLHVLDDLQERANRHLSRKESAFDRKKRIIGQSLYGVDVMDWACHVAELRLWLALVIDAEFTREELHVRREPLLPHFTFKIRCGDSLVEEVGGINLAHLHSAREIPAVLKARITKLKNEKLKFYNNESDCQFRTADQAKQEELRVFREILDTRHQNVEAEIQSLRRQVEGPQARQIGLLDRQVESRSHQTGLEDIERQKKIENLRTDLERIGQARAALRTVQDVPFVWDIAFVEIFQDEKDGFDILIGNPPYVRQENISDPRLARGEVTTENKKIYKAKLARSVYQAFPRFFGYKAATDTAAHKLNAKSDLYIYFYFHGLSLLNPKGAFCFITSNAWLDVGYGADLQEFLLKHCHVKAVLDNKVKRSFASADVNTVIVLLSAPNEAREVGLDQTARFVMFKVPFEHVLSAATFEALDAATEATVVDDYRLFPVSQSVLLQEGCEVPDDDTTDDKKKPQLLQLGAYTGNKWGGRYLRAPDIYFTILRKGKHLIMPLSKHFTGERYLNTGGADGFFILTDVQKASRGVCRVVNRATTDEGGEPFEGEIESEFLVPLIKDYTKSHKSIEVNGHDAYCLVVPGKPTANVLEYIRWGQIQGYHMRSVTKNQHPWYKPTNQMKSAARILVPRSFNDSFVIYHNPKEYLSLRFYRLHLREAKELQMVAYLNSTLVAFFLETLGNKSLGQGVLDFFMADFLALRIPVVEVPELEQAFKRMKDEPVADVWEEFGMAHSTVGQRGAPKPAKRRTDLDAIVFDALNLTRGERDAVYEAVVDSVEARLRKAESLNSKARSKRVDAVEKTRGIWAGLPEAEEEE